MLNPCCGRATVGLLSLRLSFRFPCFTYYRSENVVVVLRANDLRMKRGTYFLNHETMQVIRARKRSNSGWSVTIVIDTICHPDWVAWSNMRHYDDVFLFGIKDGKIVRVEDVPNGLSCGCICPQCDEPLIAYNNPTNKKAKHFQHKSLRQCIGYYETILHYLAKEIIKEQGFLIVPDVRFSLSAYAKNYRGDNTGYTTIGVTPTRIEFDTVELEKGVGSFRPDIKAVKNNKVCYIEIAVTHFVDEDKLQKIANSNSVVLEIDLSDCEPLTTKESLSKELFDISRMKWLHNPKVQEREAEKGAIAKEICIFVESNKRSLKVYGRDRYIYSCPIYKSEYGKIKIDDECSGCHCFAGEFEAIYPLGDEPKYPEHIVECIGHVRKKYNSLLTSKGVRLKDRW